MIAKGAHRCYRGRESIFEAWVRGDEGPADLSGVEQFEVALMPGLHKALISTVEGDSDGRLMITISGDVSHKLNRSSYSMLVSADGRVIYTASVEVVGG